MSAAPRRRRRPDPATLAVLLGYLALAFVVTGGMLRDPGSVTVANPSDNIQHAWFLSHDAHALKAGGDDLFVTDDMNTPDGVNLMWNTAMQLPGLLLAPLTLATDGLTAVAVLLWLAPALSAFGLYVALGVRVGDAPLVRRRSARVVAGLLYGFSPALLAKTLGHTNLAFLPLPPLLLVLVVEACVGRRSVRRVGLLAGVTAAAQLLIGEEVLFLTAVVGAVVALLLAAFRPQEVVARIGRFARITVVTAGVVLVLGAVPLALQFFGPQDVHGSPFTRDFFKVDVLGFTTPTDALLISPDSAVATTERFWGGAEEHTGYLGWPLILLCVVIMATAWRDLRVRIPQLVAAGLALLSLGATPLVRGVPKDGVTLPWELFLDLPFFEVVLPTRLALFTALFVAVAVAAWMDRLPQRAFPVGVLAVVVALVPLVPRPVPTKPGPTVPEFFAAGATVLPAGEAALVVPPAGFGHAQAMLWQARAGFRFRMPGGYFIGPWYDGQAVIGPRPRALLTALEDIRGTGVAAELTPELRDDAATDLRFWEARSVVVGPMRNEELAVEWLTRLLGRPPERVQGVSLWRDVTPDELRSPAAGRSPWSAAAT